MDKTELLNRLDQVQNLTAQAILQTREYIRNESYFSEQAKQDFEIGIIAKVQINISEMQILQLELEVENE